MFEMENTLNFEEVALFHYLFIAGSNTRKLFLKTMNK